MYVKDEWARRILIDNALTRGCARDVCQDEEEDDEENSQRYAILGNLRKKDGIGRTSWREVNDSQRRRKYPVFFSEDR